MNFKKPRWGFFLKKSLEILKAIYRLSSYLDSFNKYLETLPRDRKYNIEIWTKDKHLESYSRYDY